jgi:hypothetical protein
LRQSQVKYIFPFESFYDNDIQAEKFKFVAVRSQYAQDEFGGCWSIISAEDSFGSFFAHE